MKNLFWIATICYLLVLGNSSFSQDKSEDDIINDIRQKFKTISTSIDSYKKVTKDVMDESTEGGEMEAFYDGDELKKLVVKLYGETGQSIEEFYFWDNKLFFVFSRDFRYNRPIYMDEEYAKQIGESEYFDDAKTVIEENRYYFHDKKLIRWLDPKKNKIDVATPDAKQKAVETLEWVERMISKLKNKDE